MNARIAAHPGPRPSISLGIALSNPGESEWSGTVFEPVVPWDLRAWVDGQPVTVRKPPLDLSVRPRRESLAPGEELELPCPIVLVFDVQDEDPFVWVLDTPAPAAVELEASIEVDGEPVAMPRIEVQLPPVA